MSLESGKELSMEELKQRNRPRQSTAEEPLTPEPEQHPTLEEWNDLLVKLSALYRVMAAQTETLRQLSDKVRLHPLTEQLTALARETAAIRAILEQAGKPKERRFSLRLPSIRLPRPSPALLLIPVIPLVLLAVWYSWDTLWNALKTMFPM